MNKLLSSSSDLCLPVHASSATTSNEILPSIGYVRLPVILKIIPISKSAWWSGIRAGRYPVGTKISARVTAWDVQAIRSLIDSINQGEAK